MAADAAFGSWLDQVTLRSHGPAEPFVAKTADLYIDYLNYGGTATERSFAFSLTKAGVPPVKGKPGWRVGLALRPSAPFELDPEMAEAITALAPLDPDKVLDVQGYRDITGNRSTFACSHCATEPPLRAFSSEALPCEDQACDGVYRQTGWVEVRRERRDALAHLADRVALLWLEELEPDQGKAVIEHGQKIVAQAGNPLVALGARTPEPGTLVAVYCTKGCCQYHQRAAVIWRAQAGRSRPIFALGQMGAGLVVMLVYQGAGP